MLRLGHDYNGNYTAQSQVAYWKRTGAMMEVEDNGNPWCYMLEDGRTLRRGYRFTSRSKGRPSDIYVDVDNGVYYMGLCDAAQEEHSRAIHAGCYWD